MQHQKDQASPAQETPGIRPMIVQLSRKFGDRFSTGEDIRGHHANTLTWVPSQPPDAVVFAQTAAEVADIVRLAAEFHVPVIPFGAGTSLEGQVNAPHGGISIDLSRMNRIIAVNAEDCDAVVEAGVTRDQLNHHLRDAGLMFTVDPGAGNATLGGMAATRASGTMTVGYGSMRDNVINVAAVMANGELIKTANRARKSAAGYDLTRLLVGSEGTLGIIVELTVRLHPIPESTIALISHFPTVTAAASATIAALQSALALARIELLDAAMMQFAAPAAGLPDSASSMPALFVEVHGTPAAAREHADAFQEIAAAQGALRTDMASTETGRRQLWKARNDCFWAVKNASPGKSIVVTDVCVPVSRLADCLAATSADAARLGLNAPIVGHVGDGNFHAIVAFGTASSTDRSRLDEFLNNLSTRALAMDGTCTGEHGIGQGKIGALAAEMGPALQVMRLIKQALDPHSILNPGKLFEI